MVSLILFPFLFESHFSPKALTYKGEVCHLKRKGGSAMLTFLLTNVAFLCLLFNSSLLLKGCHIGCFGKSSQLLVVIVAVVVEKLL